MEWCGHFYRMRTKGMISDGEKIFTILSVNLTCRWKEFTDGQMVKFHLGGSPYWPMNLQPLLLKQLRDLLLRSKIDRGLPKDVSTGTCLLLTHATPSLQISCVCVCCEFIQFIPHGSPFSARTCLDAEKVPSPGYILQLILCQYPKTCRRINANPPATHNK